jgi:hypothetical protein
VLRIVVIANNVWRVLVVNVIVGKIMNMGNRFLCGMKRKGKLMSKRNKINYKRRKKMRRKVKRMDANWPEVLAQITVEDIKGGK